MGIENLRGGDEDRFIQTQVGDEILLYEISTGQTFLLPKELAAVYQRLDGRDSAEIAQSAFPLRPAAEGIALVEAAAQKLFEKGLLTVEDGAPAGWITRRHFVAGAVKVAALPAILTVMTGLPAAAASVTATCNTALTFNMPGTYVVNVPTCPNGDVTVVNAASTGGGGGGGASFGGNAGGAGANGCSGFPTSATLCPLNGATTVTVVIGAGGDGGSPGSAAGNAGAGGTGGAGNTNGSDGANGSPGAGAGGGGGQGGQGGQSKVQFGATLVTNDGGLGGGGGGGASLNGPGGSASGSAGGTGNPPGGDGGGVAGGASSFAGLGGAKDMAGQPGSPSVIKLTFS